MERQNRRAGKYSKKTTTTPIEISINSPPFPLVYRIFPASLAASLLALSPHILRHHQGTVKAILKLILSEHTIYAAVHRHHHLRHLPDLLDPPSSAQLYRHVNSNQAIVRILDPPSFTFFVSLHKHPSNLHDTATLHIHNTLSSLSPHTKKSSLR